MSVSDGGGRTLKGSSFPAFFMAGPAAFVLGVVAAAVVFSRGFASLVEAWATPEYSHGPIIPLVSLFLFLREMRHVPPPTTTPTDRWPGVALLFGGLAIGSIGDAVRIPDIVTYGFIVWVAGMVLICFGWRRGRLFWPAVLHLIFMLPLPQFIYWQVSIYLQTVSSQIGVAVIQFVNIPVFLDGNVIDLGVYKLQVAEACSGLRYLFPMLSFSYVFAVLYNGPIWHKVILLLSAAPITVVMNSFRIGMIGVMVNFAGIEQAEGFLHTFEGWVIFIACIIILFCEATLLQLMMRHPKRLSETLDIEFAGLGAEAARFKAIAPSKAIMTAAAATMITATAMVAAPSRTVVQPDRAPLVMFPSQLDGRTAHQQRLDRQIEAILGADDYLSASYQDAQGGPAVDLFIAYYNKQTEGSGIHSPEVCIPVGGWEVSSWEPTRVSVGDGAPFEVNRAIIQKGLQRQLVYFWFEQRGRRVISDYETKLLAVYDSLMIGRSDGGIVRLITPIGRMETEAAADARLQKFISAIVPELKRYVPD